MVSLTDRNVSTMSWNDMHTHVLTRPRTPPIQSTSSTPHAPPQLQNFQALIRTVRSQNRHYPAGTLAQHALQLLKSKTSPFHPPPLYHTRPYPPFHPLPSTLPSILLLSTLLPPSPSSPSSYTPLSSFSLFCMCKLTPAWPVKTTHPSSRVLSCPV